MDIIKDVQQSSITNILLTVLYDDDKTLKCSWDKLFPSEQELLVEACKKIIKVSKK